MSLEPGKSLSHYRLVEKIGEGGMGVVWRAEDTVLGRTVAIKVLPPEAVRDDKSRRMLFNEAKLAASMSHAHIVQVYEFGREGDLDFLVMEHVEGEPLSDLVRAGPLAPEKAVDLGFQIAEALAEAHGKGLLHRDLKPGNVLVTPDGKAKVVDFGLAMLFEQAESMMLSMETTRLVADLPTRPEGGRQVAGTLPYMSPEQTRGERLDARSDIFSLGTVLYEISTGQLPFPGQTQGEVLNAIRTAKSRPVRERIPEAPPELERIVGKALARRRSERYQEAGTLAEDLGRLKRVLAGEEPAVRPWWRDWKVALAALLVAVLSIAAYVILTPKVDAGTVLIVPLEVQGEGAEYDGLRFANALAQTLVVAENLTVLSVPEIGEVGAGGMRDKVRSARSQGAGRLLTGSVSREGETVRVSLSLVDSSANRVLWGTEQELKGEWKHLAMDVSREVAKELGVAPRKFYHGFEIRTDNPELARLQLYQEALAAGRRGNYPAFRAGVEELLEDSPDDPDLLNMAIVAFMYTGAPDKANESLAHLMQVDPDAPWGTFYEAVLKAQSHPDEAIALYTELLERNDLAPDLRSGILGERAAARLNADLGDEAGFRDLDEALRVDPLNYMAHFWYASALQLRGRLEEALVHARLCAEIVPLNPFAQNVLAELLFDTDRWTEAAAVWGKRCEAEPRQAICAKHAYALHGAGREQEALQAAKVAQGLQDEVDGTWYLARYRVLAGDREAALELLRRHLDVNPQPDLLLIRPTADGMDFFPLRGDPAFEDLVAGQWSKAVDFWGERCASAPTQGECALQAAALYLTGQEAEAREVAAKAASMKESAPSTLNLAWYHALARERDDVIRLLQRRSELAGPLPGPHLGEHYGFEWLRGDPEFDALAAELGRRTMADAPD